ncbi:hypothetical protein M501DRAFT_165646 [Patellaria atrata CBS 101060]|uniref:Uncharacterized protein n=1 Tax=Patellaria atrata CBS 101060 TaxID=1346257 RepID=A0A9P4S7D6_9PEZI|nr:hypothetical protein M501DRAFT_165646 [Patellaria atrata CBS 101060]
MLPIIPLLLNMLMPHSFPLCHSLKTRSVTLEHGVSFTPLEFVRFSIPSRNCTNANPGPQSSSFSSLLYRIQRSMVASVIVLSNRSVPLCIQYFNIRDVVFPRDL